MSDHTGGADGVAITSLTTPYADPNLLSAFEAMWSARPIAMPFKNLKLKRLYQPPAKRPDKRAEAAYLAGWYQIEQQGLRRPRNPKAVAPVTTHLRRRERLTESDKCGAGGGVQSAGAAADNLREASPAPAFASHQEASMTDLEVMQQRAGAIGLSVVYLHPIFVIRIGNGCLRSYTDPQAALECLNKLEARHAATIPVRG
jgi:hypothetical protein